MIHPTILLSLTRARLGLPLTRYRLIYLQSTGRRPESCYGGGSGLSIYFFVSGSYYNMKSFTVQTVTPPPNWTFDKKHVRAAR